jgi:two-component system LytT family response regulator
MIKTILIDDEPEALRGMESMLGIFCPMLEIIGKAHSVSSGLFEIQQLRPDLIFLDIAMRDGTGFELLEKCKERNFATIFVTAYDQYAIKALRMNAMDYLMKPVDPDELCAAVERVKNKPLPEYNHLLSAYANNQFTKIGVPNSKGVTYLEINNIVRLESSNNYTYIHTKGQKAILVSRTIKSFESLLPADKFVRCHQRHIINLDLVLSLERTDGTHILMGDGTVVPISRANKTHMDNLLSKRFPTL